MPRLSLLTWSLALLSLGAGTIGYSTSLDIVRAEPASRASPGARMAEPLLKRPAADTEIMLHAGESLAEGLLEAKVAGLDAVLVESSAESLPPAAGRPVRLWLGARLDSGARLLERVEYRREGGRKVSLERSGDVFERKVTFEQADETPIRVRLAIAPSLAGELVALGLPRRLRTQVEDALRGHRSGSLDLVVSHEATGSESHFGPLLYLGIHRSDGLLQRWLGDNGALRPLEMQAPDAGMLRPIPGPITSTPGLRVHPILRYLRWHRGTDFGAPSGTPVQAALGGRVIEAGWRGGYGRVVRLRHDDGSTTLYAHLSRITVGEGDGVAKGALLGAVGASGLATGPHLHFEWVRGSETLTPRFAAATTATNAGLRTEQREALRAVLAVPYRPARTS